MLQRSWLFSMHSWIRSFNPKIADPIRSDQGVSNLDLDPIQIHKNRIFDPDRGSFRSDHYITVRTQATQRLPLFFLFSKIRIFSHAVTFCLDSKLHIR